MILACDIGNSRLKFGTFTEDILTDYYAFNNTEDSIKFILALNPEVIAISSVSPFKQSELHHSIKSKSSSKFFLINRNSKLNFKINYKTPGTLGIDRLCSAEGALYLLKLNNEYREMKENDFFITIDFGTATTINIVKFPNLFEGGLIMPGLKIMSECLHSAAEQLPKINITPSASIVGKTTIENINSGINNSTIGLIERVIKKIKAEFNSEVRKIFITGGNAKMIMDNFDFEYSYCRELVLYGIKSIYDLNKTTN